MTNFPGRWIGPILAGLVLLTSWAAAWSWSPLYADPGGYRVPALVGGLAIVTVGLVCRASRLPPVAVPVLQLAAGALFLDAWFSLPVTSARLGTQLVHGSEQLNEFAAPVPARYVAIAVFLTACALALVIAVDLCVLGLGRVPLAGLPLLLALTVPISVLTQRLPITVFIGTAVPFLALLALEHTRALRGWGREVGPSARHRFAILLGASRVGALALAGAIVVPVLIPVTSGVFSRGDGANSGNGNRSVTLVNPMLDIRRDLIQKTHTPLVEVHTNDPDPSYLRLTVLDQFTGAEWRASNRQLPASNRASGALPIAPGLAPDAAGRATSWQIALTKGFETNWLPTPYPVTSLAVTGDWRFDSRTLDIVNTGPATASEGLSYRVNAFKPVYDANLLNVAGTPVGQPVEGMTALPGQLPTVIARTAERLTRGATTEYEKLAVLQDWFRSNGGFTYSTAPAPGSGMALLAAFVTRDRVGYCEQFAAAMAVMGRTLGIPARVVVGFLRPTGAVSGAGNRLFTSDDLHAWPEFYFAGSGWIRFEPTPGARTGTPPAYTDQTLTPIQPNRPTPTSNPRQQQQHAPALRPPRSTDVTGSGGGAWGWLWLPGVVLLGLLGGLPRGLRARRRRVRLASQDAVELSRGAWAELRATALDHRIAWADDRSARQALALLRARVSQDPDLVRELAWFGEFVERSRYARSVAISSGEAARVRECVKDWSAEIRQMVSDRTARSARWWPTSLFDRRPATKAQKP